MRDSVGRHQQVTGGHRQFAPFEEKKSTSLDDLIHLVHALVRVESVRLPWFKTVEADEQVVRLE